MASQEELEQNDMIDYQRQQEQLQQHLMNQSPDQEIQKDKRIDFYGLD